MDSLNIQTVLRNNKLNQVLMIAVDDLDNYVSNGWKLGRKFSKPISK